ncbi:MAG: aminopeptidase [Candidatus Margulisiibacteriota bacterium]
MNYGLSLGPLGSMRSVYYAPEASSTSSDQITGLCQGEQLAEGARMYLEGMMGLKSGERVLITYDTPNQETALAFERAAKQKGALVTMYNIDLNGNRFNEAGVKSILGNITPQAASFLDKKSFDALSTKAEKGEPFSGLQSKQDVFLNFIDMRPGESAGRIKMVMAEIILGKATGTVRTGHGPGITREMVCLKPDFNAMEINANKLLELLKGADKVRITTAKGTDVELAISGRTPLKDVMIGPGIVGNLPSGEVYMAPHETKGSGVLIVDGSIGDQIIVPSPMKVVIENGKVISTGWLDPAFSDPKYLEETQSRLKTDDQAGILGEFGIGLAPFPIIGNMLQDEKSVGSIHIAFGNNSPDYPGGQNTSTDHSDFVIQKATVVLSYPKESGKAPVTIMSNGQFLF